MDKINNSTFKKEEKETKPANDVVSAGSANIILDDDFFDDIDD